MSITDLINVAREKLIAHEYALREVATLANEVCAALDMFIFSSEAFDEVTFGDQRHFLRIFPNGERRSKQEIAPLLHQVIPPDWRVSVDTGHEWINVFGTLNGYLIGMTIYTRR